MTVDEALLWWLVRYGSSNVERDFSDEMQNEAVDRLHNEPVIGFEYLEDLYPYSLSHNGSLPLYGYKLSDRGLRRLRVLRDKANDRT